MPYPDIPKPNDLISNSQNPLRIFFNNVSACIAQNQYPVSDAQQGKNFRVLFRTRPMAGFDPAGIIAPEPQMSPNESELYVMRKGNAPGAEIDLHYQRESGNRIQLTGPEPVLGPSGYTFLPGGLLIQWGTRHLVLNPETVTFPVAFSANAYTVVITPQRTNSADVPVDTTILEGSITAADFQIFRARTAPSSIQFCNWMAIGPQ